MKDTKCRFIRHGFFYITLLLSYCAVVLEASAAPPVAAFASPPDFRQPALSPNGQWIAAIRQPLSTESLDGELSVPRTRLVLIAFEGGEEKILVEPSAEPMHINWLQWISDDLILFSAAVDSKRGTVERMEAQLFVVDISSGEYWSALPEGFWRNKKWVPVAQDRVVDFLAEDDESILLALETQRPGSAGVYWVNVVDGRVRLEERPRSRVVDWIADRQHRVRIGVETTGDGYRVIYRAPDSRRWGPLWSFKAFSPNQVWPLGFGRNENVLYVSAYYEGRKAIFKIDLAKTPLSMELVFSDPAFDVIGNLIYSSKTNDVVGTTYTTNGGYSFWKWEFLGLQQAINRVLSDTSNIVQSFSQDERRYIVLATSDIDAGTFYIGDRDTQRIKPFAFRYERLDPEEMSETQITQYEARDGLSIQAFLTLPKQRHTRPLPAIIFPHGGPMSFDNGGFNHWTQFLASRGYAVLQMNYRGSMGYGYAFMQAGLQGWGREMQHDVEDGARWLIDQGIAEAGRMCIVGSSYGGYAALMGAINNPDLYQCAVSFAGVTDLEYLFDASKGYLHHGRVAAQIGSDKKLLREYSPVQHAARVGVPILLVHGANDQQVPLDHAKRMVAALESHDKPLIYIEQEEGDHYLSRYQDRISFYRALESFLTEHLPTDLEVSDAPR